MDKSPRVCIRLEIIDRLRLLFFSPRLPEKRNNLSRNDSNLGRFGEKPVLHESLLSFDHWLERLHATSRSEKGARGFSVDRRKG